MATSPRAQFRHWILATGAVLVIAGTALRLSSAPPPQSSEPNVFTSFESASAPRTATEAATPILPTRQFDARDILEKVPLAFERLDDARGGADYLARGAEYDVELRRSGATMLLADPSASSVSVAMQLVGAALEGGSESLERLTGGVNRVHGTIPRAWQLDLPHYRGAIYRGVYPGVDVLYRGNGQRLEYDFIVAPRADPGHIRLMFPSVRRPYLSAGDLVLPTPAGDVRHLAPVAYQLVGDRRRSVSARFALREDGTTGFELGAYDPGLPVVIDPVIVYHRSFGTELAHHFRDVRADVLGNAHLVGCVGEAQTDVWFVKLDPSGSTVLFDLRFGGAEFDCANAVSLDAAGNAYVAGQTESADFPAVDPLRPYGGLSDGFVTRIDASGAITWSTHLGGSARDGASGVAVDPSGNLLVSGATSSRDFPTLNAFQSVHAGPRGGDDAFLTKIAAGGGSLVFSTFLGGGRPDAAADVAADVDGNSYLIGRANSPSFPRNIGPPFGGGGVDIFVAKFSPSGARIYSRFLGGMGVERSGGIAVDETGAAYAVGLTGSSDFPRTTGGNPDPSGGNGFVTKLSPAGDKLVYSRLLAGTGVDEALSIDVDPCGHAIVGGVTDSPDFPRVLPLQPYGGSADAFVTILSRTGRLAFSTHLGSTDNEIAAGIDADRCAGNVYVAGQGPGPGDQPNGAVWKIRVDTDVEADQLPDIIEADVSANPRLRDNDIFTRPLLFAMQQYRDFFQREGDLEGVAFWARQIASGSLARAEVVRSFLESDEFQLSTAPVIRLYFAFFVRIPDTAGLEFWLTQFQNGASLEEISEAFAESPEFQQRYGSLTDQQFVEQIYRDLLGRDPDPGGLSFWTAQLSSGATRAQVLLSFSESVEFIQKSANEVLVTQTYVAMLERAPDSDGFAFWVAALDDGGSELALIQGHLASDEYHDRFLP